MIDIKFSKCMLYTFISIYCVLVLGRPLTIHAKSFYSGVVIPPPLIHVQHHNQSALAANDALLYTESVRAFESNLSKSFSLIHGVDLIKRASAIGLDHTVFCAPKGVSASAAPLGARYLVCQDFIQVGERQGELNYHYQVKVFNAHQNTLIYQDSALLSGRQLKSGLRGVVEGVVATFSHSKNESNRVKSDREQLPRGEIYVLSDPPSATLMVNGQSYGVSPQRISLPSGTFWLTASYPGYRSESRHIKVKENQESQVEMKLKPIGASLTLESSPSGSGVYLNGQLLGFTPLHELRLPVQESGLPLHLTLVKEGYVSESFNITPRDGAHLVESVILLPLSEMLVVQTYTPNLRLVIDRDISKSYPLTAQGLHRIPGIKRGRHTLEVYRVGETQPLYRTSVDTPNHTVIPLPEKLDMKTIEVAPKTVSFKVEPKQNEGLLTKAPGLTLLTVGTLAFAYGALQLREMDLYMRESYLRIKPTEREFYELKARERGEFGWTSIYLSTVSLAMGAALLHVEW